MTNFLDRSLVSGYSATSSDTKNSASSHPESSVKEENINHAQAEQSVQPEQKEHHEQVEKHKFVGRSREREDILKSMSPRANIEPTADVIRWTEILGIDSSTFTAEDVHRAWRRQISSPEVHPDLGGELEAAILLNIAKDSLTKWLDSFAPKLGKQFLQHK